MPGKHKVLRLAPAPACKNGWPQNQRGRSLRMTLAISLLFFPALMSLVAPAQAQQDVVIKAMQDELARSMAQLRFQNMEKPYFIAYRVEDVNQTTVSATLGSLSDSHPLRLRAVGVELRVGDYALDNSNYISFRSSGGMQRMFSTMMQVPLDNDYDAIRRQLWLVTDAEYKKALEDFSSKRATLQGRQGNDEVADFSHETPAHANEPPSSAKFDVAAAERLARELSALFRQMPDVFTSSVEIGFHNNYTRYVNSEGTSFTRPDAQLTLEIKASTQARDGEPLKDSLEYYGASLSDLPSREKLELAIRDMGARMTELRAAPLAERYNGPVLFEGDVAAEVFAQIFAPSVVAARLPMSDNPQFETAMLQMYKQAGGSFVDKIGARVLPEFMDLVDNPRLEQAGGKKLAGDYKVDDEGVPTHETKLVEKGMLKTLLASRTPVVGIEHSTGNRRGIGAAPSNLVLKAEKTASEEELRKELLKRAKLRGREYGLIVRRVGTALNPAAARMSMIEPADDQVQNAMLAVYKLFPDGHEEPVRGAEVADLTVAAFRDILAAGDKPVVFSDQFVSRAGSLFSIGMVALSDGFPVVSYVAPSLLFEEVSVKRTAGPFPRPPVSKPPLASGESPNLSLQNRERQGWATPGERRGWPAVARPGGKALYRHAR